MFKKIPVSLLVFVFSLIATVGLVCLNSPVAFAESFGEEVDGPPPGYSSDYSSNVTSNVTSNITSDNTSCCCPRGPIGIILDQNFSPVVGSSGLISIWRTYMSLDDYLYPNTEGDTSCMMMLGRLGKLSLEDIAVSTGMVTQHEIFGHGWRAREFDLSVFKYSIRPYSGYTVFSLTQFNQLSPSERISFIAGGMEATGILAKQLRNRWLETKSIDEREGHFYLVTSLDQTLYVMKTKPSSNGPYGNDVQAYVQQLNNWFGRPVLTPRSLRNRELFDLFDPYVWFSLYGMGHYIIDGSQCFEYPMIPIGDYQYLPGFRIALAPYGPEYQFINYIRALDYTMQATFRYGNTGGKNSEGLILEMTRLWDANCFSIDGRFDIWSQPKLFVPTAQQAARKFGGAASLFARYRILNNFELMGQLGYKMKGYMPGEALKRGAILRAGFFVHL